MTLSPGQWRTQGQRARLGAHEIFWVDTGEVDRPTVVLLHGFPTSSWDWQPIWAGLHETHRVVALDLLGFGFSEKPYPHAYSILEQADLCEALVAQCRLDAFDVIAHDYGNTVAQELLARQNEGRGQGRWESVCFLNGGLFPETHRPRLIQRLLLSPLGSLVARLTSKRAFARSFRAIFGPDTQPSAADIDGFWTLLNHDHGRRGFPSLIGYMPERQEHRRRWVGALTDTDVPIGIINGSLDPVSGAHMVARYREVIARQDFIVELPTIGHYPQVEAPAAVLAAYARFEHRVRAAGAVQ